MDTGHFGHSAQTKMDTGPMKQARIQGGGGGGGGARTPPPTAVCNIFVLPIDKGGNLPEKVENH